MVPNIVKTIFFELKIPNNNHFQDLIVRTKINWTIKQNLVFSHKISSKSSIVPKLITNSKLYEEVISINIKLKLVTNTLTNSVDL